MQGGREADPAAQAAEDVARLLNRPALLRLTVLARHVTRDLAPERLSEPGYIERGFA
jgi:hypothetical protein